MYCTRLGRSSPPTHIHHIPPSNIIIQHSTVDRSYYCTQAELTRLLIMAVELVSVLVVGGCGFLGHHIVSQLLEKFPSARISVLDLRTAHNRFPSVSYYDGDITSVEAVQHILGRVGPQVIIHTASPVVADFKGSPTLYYKVNVDGTRILLECAGQIGCVRAFVYTSSASVIHDGDRKSVV